MSANINSTVLVTGGAGFVGSHICEQLLNVGRKVILIDALNSETSSKEEKLDNIAYLETVSKTNPDSRLSVHIGNILDEPMLCQILRTEEPVSCIHAASLVMDRRSVYSANEFINQNIYGTQCLLEALAKTGTVRHLVYISSRSAVGEKSSADALMTENDLLRPINPYGASKAAVEAFCHVFYKKTNTPVTVCRMQPMYGPRGRPDMLPRRLMEGIYAGVPIEIYGDGESVRDWMYIKDGVDGILAAEKNPQQFSIFNFGTGVITTTNKLISLVEQAESRRANVVHVDKLSGDAYFGGVCDFSKAENILNWKPSMELKKGLMKTFEYFMMYRSPGSTA